MSDSKNLLLPNDQKLDMSGDIVLKYCAATLITIVDEGLKITVHYDEQRRFEVLYHSLFLSLSSSSIPG
jgi:ribulose bisphosphate carboxylase small subunit